MFLPIKLCIHAKLNWLKQKWLFVKKETDLALNNLQKIICHKTQPTNQEKYDAQSCSGFWDKDWLANLRQRDEFYSFLRWTPLEIVITLQGCNFSFFHFFFFSYNALELRHLSLCHNLLTWLYLIFNAMHMSFQCIHCPYFKLCGDRILFNPT